MNGLYLWMICMGMDREVMVNQSPIGLVQVWIASLVEGKWTQMLFNNDRSASTLTVKIVISAHLFRNKKTSR